MNPRDTITPQLVVGLAVMAAGFLMTLDVLGVLHARDYLKFWPIVLIVIGAQTIAAGGRRSAGAIQLFLGVWFLLLSLRVVPRQAWVLFGPFMLMVVGGIIVTHTLRRHQAPRHDLRETIAMAGILGGSERTSQANPFRGGELMAFMGGGRIDLRGAVIPPGGEATVDVLCMMGGYEIDVPDSWVVDDRTTAILGGNHSEARSRPDATSVLVLRGFVFMGGCAIKN